MSPCRCGYVDTAVLLRAGDHRGGPILVGTHGLLIDAVPTHRMGDTTIPALGMGTAGRKTAHASLISKRFVRVRTVKDGILSEAHRRTVGAEAVGRNTGDEFSARKGADIVGPSDDGRSMR